jgi:hypothetical protein
MKVALIAEGVAQPVAALGAVVRYWNVELLSGEGRFDFLVEGEVILRDLEGDATLFAGLLHRRFSIPP